MGFRNSKNVLFWLFSAAVVLSCKDNTGKQDNKDLHVEKITNAGEPRNVIFILSDDHRFDFMDFTGKVRWLETPNMDRLAREGAYFPNTFVTTAQTPTMHGVRTDRYKLIRYHGIWDTNEFFDLEEDPYEMNNLIAAPEHQERIKELTSQIYDWLEETDGMQIPLKRTVRPHSGDHRNRGLF